MLNTVDGPSEQVEDYLCDPEEMPLGARNSRLPCPEDCVLSDWEPWSVCSLVNCSSCPTRRHTLTHTLRPLCWFLSPAAATALEDGLPRCCDGLVEGRSVQPPARRSPANSTATASTTPTTSLVSGHHAFLDLCVCVCVYPTCALCADWSTCQLSERAVCGNGIKTRMLDCVRSDGKSVDLKLCKEVRRQCVCHCGTQRWRLFDGPAAG